jgi:hypothetical protein
MTDPNAAAAELTSLSAGGKIIHRHAIAAVSLIRATCDPGATSFSAQAATAVSSGQLKPVTDLTAIYDLGPLNQLLHAATQAPVQA